MTRSYVAATHSVQDGDGFIWDIYRDGSIYDGTNNAFDYGMDFTQLSTSYYLEADTATQTYTTLATSNYSGIISQRQIHISPTDGFARFYDTVTNASTSAQSFTYRLTLNFGSNGSTAFETSTGDSAVNDDDTWVVGYSSNNDTTPSGAVFGENANDPSASLTAYYDTVTYEFTVNLAAGESASFLSFAVQGNSYTDVASSLDDLQDLPTGALNGLTAEQLSTIVNWDIPDTNQDLVGTPDEDALFGASGNDSIRTLDSDDLAFGGGGADTIRGGFGSDTLHGGNGADILYGDGSVVQVTTSQTETLDTGEEIAISLTMADAGSGGRTQISGFVSRQEVTSDNVDLVFAIDVSGSTSSQFSGSVNVGDRNGDGVSNTILDAEIASFEALHASIVSDANLPDANITIVPFASSAGVSQTYTATQDQDQDGVADVLQYVRSLQDGGGTDFEAALQTALHHFESGTDGQNVLYFLSDGGNNEGGSLDDEVQDLLDLGVQIQSFGVGSGASETDLDIVDDNIDNNSTTIVLDPSALTDELLDPGIAATDLDSLFVYLNGVRVASIDPADLIITPFGLRYFELEIDGLRNSADDVIEVRAIAADGSNTVISTSQVLEHLNGTDGKDLLIGGAGNDRLEGGDDKDILMGGRGQDTLSGGAGNDIASYADAETGVVVDLSGRLGFQGEAFGDTLNSIEGLIGSGFSDELVGNNKKNILRGNGGDDVLSGKGGKDTLHGGRGDDELSGGGGADRFIFKENGGVDTIIDFQRGKRAEKVDLRDFEIDSFSDLRGMMSTVNGDAVIDFGNGDELIFEDITASQLRANDFIL